MRGAAADDGAGNSRFGHRCGVLGGLMMWGLQPGPLFAAILRIPFAIIAPVIIGGPSGKLEDK